jgi:hypothetical protein
MPASKHTKKAKTARKKRQWQHVVDSVEAKGGSRASAIIQANGVLKQGRGRKGRKR